MNSLSDEIKFSLNPSKPSSEYEDSLTSKLEKGLHSSDDVNGSNFQSGSQNASERNSQVPEAPEPRPFPLKGKRRKNAGSYASLGTVVRHEAPNVKLKILNKKSGFKGSSQRSSRNSYLEKEYWLFFKKIVKKNPEFKQAAKKEKDFEEFFMQKFNEFEEMLLNNLDQGFNLNYEKIKMKNKEKLKKSEEIRFKLQEAELERVKKSFDKFEENCKYRLKVLIDKNLKKFKNLKIAEDCRLENEKTMRIKQQKQTIVENIRNYYDDKIKIFKEKLRERKTSKNLIDVEHKIVFSEARRERFRESRIRHEKSLDLIKGKVDKIKMELEDEKEEIEKKIVKLYKNSMRSLKKF